MPRRYALRSLGGVVPFHTQLRDIVSRVRVAAVKGADLATRIRLQSVKSADLLSRIRLQSLKNRDLAVRALVDAVRSADIGGRSRIQAVRRADLPSRVLLQALRPRDIVTRVSVGATRLRDLTSRMLVKGIANRDLASRVRLQVLSVRDVPSRVRLGVGVVRDLVSRVRVNALSLGVHSDITTRISITRDPNEGIILFPLPAPSGAALPGLTLPIPVSPPPRYSLALPDQPTVMTAPFVQGSVVPAGATFSLTFALPITTLTLAIFLPGSTCVFTFATSSGKMVTGPVTIVSATTLSQTFQVTLSTTQAIALS